MQRRKTRRFYPVPASLLVLPAPFNIVVVGNSVMGGAASSAPHKPAIQLATNLTNRGITNTTTDRTQGGTDTQYWYDNFDTTVHDLHVNGQSNVCILLETSDYVDDTLGSAGTGVSLTNPNGAGASDYGLFVAWAQRAIAKTSTSPWYPIAVCAPDCEEPGSYADAAANALYRQARDKSYSLMRANYALGNFGRGGTDFWRLVDARSRPEFSDPNNATYYSGGIHLSDTGNDLLGLICSQVFP